MKQQQRGFTFIELLVSITIIILLSAVAVVSYQSANKRARDNKRKADLEQIRSALEMYRTDNDEYPAVSSALVPDYLQEWPADPKTAYSYCYNRLTTTTYELCAYFETGGNGGACSCSCGSEVTCNYELNNP